MSVQSIAGVIISTITAGIIFAKFTMPRKRGQTVIFSKNAVITLRNGANLALILSIRTKLKVIFLY